ncbi:hypothetical protein GCM10009609_63470 [Pseudonocardia aurantiaca]
MGPGEHGVAGAEHLEVRRLLAQRPLDGVGKRGLVARDALHVDEGGAEVDGVSGEIENGPGHDPRPYRGCCYQALHTHTRPCRPS